MILTFIKSKLSNRIIKFENGPRGFCLIVPPKVPDWKSRPGREILRRSVHSGCCSETFRGEEKPQKLDCSCGLMPYGLNGNKMQM